MQFKGFTINWFPEPNIPSMCLVGPKNASDSNVLLRGGRLQVSTWSRASNPVSSERSLVLHSPNCFTVWSNTRWTSCSAERQVWKEWDTGFRLISGSNYSIMQKTLPLVQASFFPQSSATERTKSEHDNAENMNNEQPQMQDLICWYVWFSVSMTRWNLM